MLQQTVSWASKTYGVQLMADLTFYLEFQRPPAMINRVSTQMLGHAKVVGLSERCFDKSFHRPKPEPEGARGIYPRGQQGRTPLLTAFKGEPAAAQR